MKILIVSEFTGLGATGYSNYYKEIAVALYGAGHEVVELGSYGDNNNASHVRYQRTCPWKVILNQPRHENKSQVEAYHARERSHRDAKFGAWSFDQIVAEEHPDVVLAIRDHWYDKFIVDSPAAPYYLSVLQTTCDAMPQKGEWLSTFGKADILTTYNKWSEDWLKTQYSSHNLFRYISPPADSTYRMLSKSKCRDELRIPSNIKLVGTVMRNQPRKKFDHLFGAISKTEDVYLYIHTAYPDRGWDIPTLLLQHGIANRTYITYLCASCNHFEAKLYSGRSIKCPNCPNKMETPSPRKGLDLERLCKVYNTMDLYAQIHNSEGFGIPVLEAAKCGIRVLTVDYSAQEDVGPKVGAIMMKPHSLDREISSNCYRAIPDIELLASHLNNPSIWEYSRQSIVDLYDQNYSWPKTTQKWVNLINSLEPKKMWNTEPSLKTPLTFQQLQKMSLTNSDFLVACILQVAFDPKLLGSYMHTEYLDSLNSEIYFNQLEDSNMLRVDRKWVYDKFRRIIDQKNHWESQRKKLRAQFLDRQK